MTDLRLRAYSTESPSLSLADQPLSGECVQSGNVFRDGHATRFRGPMHACMVARCHPKGDRSGLHHGGAQLFRRDLFEGSSEAVRLLPAHIKWPSWVVEHVSLFVLQGYSQERNALTFRPEVDLLRSRRIMILRTT